MHVAQAHINMRTLLQAAMLASCVWAMGVPQAALAAGAKGLPARDLTVELRQIDEAKLRMADATQDAAVGKSYSAGAPSAPDWEPQMVQVRNGEKASLRMQSAMPMQWVKSAFVQTDTAAQPTASGAATVSGVGKASGTTTAAGVKNALAWFDAGQSINVQPKWNGGKTAVVELEVQSASFEPRTGADLPAQNRNAVSTTVTAPLAQWITIAATGKAPQAAQSTTYSSDAAQQTRRLLQIRVMAP